MKRNGPMRASAKFKLALWMGVRFWGPAVTMRVIPSHRMMPPVSVV